MNFTVESKSVTSSNTSQVFNIKSYVTCDSENIVYIIRDKICVNIFHIGYAEDNMKVRGCNQYNRFLNGISKVDIKASST